MKITVRSDGFEGYKKRALARAAKLARREPVRPEVTITFDNPLEMLEVLTADLFSMYKNSVFAAAVHALVRHAAQREAAEGTGICLTSG